MTAPLPLDSLERRGRRALGTITRWVLVPVMAIAIVALIVLGTLNVMRRRAMLDPRHRAEALCFVLAQPPAFAPPVSVDPSVAVVRGRFSDRTPAGLAAREAMRFGDDHVVSEKTRRVGDYDVAVLWLRLPGASGARHWLVVAWMDGPDLELCSFRFAADELTPEILAAGDRLLGRLLRPQHFRAGTLPAARWQGGRGASLPTFGPATGS